MQEDRTAQYRTAQYSSTDTGMQDIQVQKDRTNSDEPEKRNQGRIWRSIVSVPNLPHDLVREGQNVFVGV